MYFVGKGSYGDGEQYKDPTAELIKQQFESMNWNDVDERPIIKLSQKKDGKIRMIQVRRNQSSAGELHVAWIDMPDGQVFSGESTQIESPDMLLKLLLAFSDNSQEIKTMIDWDYVEE